MNKLTRLLILTGLWLLGAVAHAGTVTYVYTDPQGTPLAEADVSGNITARFDYSPYGTAVASMSPAPNGPGYTGHVNDPDTGLVYMQARYYDPSTGRFLSVDPVGPSGGNFFTFNRYNYVSNNPINRIDPFGKYLCKQGADCEKIAAALKDVSTAAGNLPEGSSERNDLTQIIGFYGKEGDDNGVTIVNGSFKAAANAITESKNSGFLGLGERKVTITIDFEKISANKSENSAEFAGLVAHEGRHGYRDKNKSIQQGPELEEEKMAFRTQGYVSQGLGVKSGYGLWSPGDTKLDQDKVDSWAAKSAEISGNWGKQ